MSTLKKPNIGVYGPKTRLLQKRISYEHLSLTWKTANVYKYLGSRTNLNPAIDDIQDIVFMTTPDRAYDATPIEVNVDFDHYEDQGMNFSRFGMIDPMGNETNFKFHSYSFESNGLGRYIIEGDVIEIPFLNQDGENTYFEVTNVDRKTEFENYIVSVTAKPVDDRQETAEIPNMNTNDNVMQTVETELEAEQSSEVPQEGVTGDVTVSNPDPATTPYDPRPKYDKDFLDDPNAKTF